MAVFSDDWESGTGNWSTTGSTGTWSADTSVFHGGTHSYKIVNGTGTQSSIAVHNLGVDVANCRVDFWCRVETDTGFHEIAEMRDSGSTHQSWVLTYAGSGVLALFGFRINGGTSVEVDTTGIFSTATWHHVVIDFNCAASSSFSITVDGTKFSSAVADYSGAAKPHILQLWNDATSNTHYYDDLVVTDLSAGGGTNATQTLSATSTTGATIVKTPGKVLAASTTTAATIAKQAGKALSAVSTTTASLVRAPAHAISATQASAATLLKTPGKALSATLTSAASIAKQAGKALAATSTTTATIGRRAVTFALSAGLTTTATMSKFVSKAAFAVASTTTATVTGSRVTFQTLSASITTSATISKLVSKALSATSATGATMSRAVSKTLSATATLGAALSKGVSKTFSAISSLVASVVGQQVTVQANVIGDTEPLGRLDIEPGVGSLDIEGSIGRLDIDRGP